jgi:hypothetical protein
LRARGRGRGRFTPRPTAGQKRPVRSA